MDEKYRMFYLLLAVIVAYAVYLTVMQMINVNTINKQVKKIEKLERENETFEQYVREYVPEDFRNKYDKEHAEQWV